MRTRRILMLGVAAVIALGSLCPAAAQEVLTLNFAPVGNSYSAAIFGDNPLVGREVVAVRVYLLVRRSTNSKIKDFFTDILLPIEPFPGSEQVLVIRGSDLNRIRRKTFEYIAYTTRFNGTIVPRRYGAQTGGEHFKGRILPGSKIELVLQHERTEEQRLEDRR